MSTEDLDPHFTDLDRWTSLEAVSAMLEGQFAAIGAVQGAASAIAKAVDAAALSVGEHLYDVTLVAASGTPGRTWCTSRPRPRCMRQSQWRSRRLVQASPP